jgi:hypothetical protein
VYDGETLDFGIQDPRADAWYYDLMPNQNLQSPISLSTEYNNMMDFNIKFEDFSFQYKNLTVDGVDKNYMFLLLNVNETLLDDFRKLATYNHYRWPDGDYDMETDCGLVFQFSIRVRDAFDYGLYSDNYEFNVFLSHEPITS